MSKKEPEKSQMSELVFASRMMRERIAPPGSAPTVGARVAAAARHLKWKYSRAFSVWYADERVSLKPRELRQIEEFSGVKFGQQEVNEIDNLISRAGALLESQDQDFHSAFVAAIRAFTSALDSTRAGKG
jgi:hypothetical protein